MTKIKVKESGRSAVIVNPAKDAIDKIEVDGCVLKNELACDWVLSLQNKWDIFIELKGRDVSHAVDQLRATIDHWRHNDLLEGQAAALVVCSQYPRIDTVIQKAKAEFARRYKLPLHVEAKNREYTAAEVLSFAGPA
jgi:hypothetical protein